MRKTAPYPCAARNRAKKGTIAFIEESGQLFLKTCFGMLMPSSVE